MKTIVFGGAGFVGLNIVENLLNRGEEVIIFDANPIPLVANEFFSNLPGKLVRTQGDVKIKSDIQSALKTNPGAIIYGAAVTAGLERDKNAPSHTLEVNLNGFLNVLEVAKDYNIKKIINLSSAGAYGEAAFGPGPLDEIITKADPKNIYSISKFASERIAQRLGKIWNMEIVNVRLSAVFGRWERQTSVRDTPSPQYQIMMKALSGNNVLLERPDARDWIYGPDVAEAVRLLRDKESFKYDLYNLSTGKPWSIEEWGLLLEKEFPGFKCRLVEEGEISNISSHTSNDRAILKINKLVDEIPFDAKFNLKESIKDYVAWIKAIDMSYFESK